MLKIDNNSNKLLISHISDIDGMGSVILSKLVSNMDIILISIEEVTETINNLIKDNKYEEIYMCDLSMPDDLAGIVDGKIPLKHFDHHQTNTYSSRYSWSLVIVEENGLKVSGTSLFYKYLITNKLIKKSIKLDEFVEAIRSNDTRDLKSNYAKLGKDLTMIFSMLGPLRFIDRFYNRLIDSNKTFLLNDFEKELIILKENEMNDYIDKSDKNLIKTTLFDYKIGISISEGYRSELGNRLSLKYKDELDFILIVDFMRHSFSLRTVNDINLGEFAKKLGGGGHAKAAGFPMNKENLEMILELIKNNFNY